MLYAVVVVVVVCNSKHPLKYISEIKGRFVFLFHSEVLENEKGKFKPHYDIYIHRIYNFCVLFTLLLGCCFVYSYVTFIVE